MGTRHAHLLELIDNFYLTDEQLEQSPSRAKGVDAETEKRLRIYGCDRIQRAVVLLDLPQVVAATAQILLHRFYSQQDLREWHVRVRLEPMSTMAPLAATLHAQRCSV